MSSIVAPTEVESPTTTDESGAHAHIVYVPEVARTTLTPQALVTAARIEGFHVIALCGYTWIPQRDPASLPVCPKCREIYEQPGEHRDERDRLPDA